MDNAIFKAMEEAEEKAWKALSTKKYMQFGYQAEKWTDLNSLLTEKRDNPFRDLIKLSKKKVREKNE